MKITDIEDGEQLVTKEHLGLVLKAELATLEAKLLKAIMESERAQRGWIFGTYGLIVAAIFINHFWR